MAYPITAWRRVDTSGSANLHEKNAYGHVCEATISAADATSVDMETPPFDWAVTTDFTVIVNAEGTSLDNTPSVTGLETQGSGVKDGTYIVMSPVAGSVLVDGRAGSFIHDITTHGVMPFMRVFFTSFDADPCTSGTKKFKIMVIPHVT